MFGRLVAECRWMAMVCLFSTHLFCFIPFRPLRQSRPEVKRLGHSYNFMICVSLLSLSVYIFYMYVSLKVQSFPLIWLSLSIVSTYNKSSQYNSNHDACIYSHTHTIQYHLNWLLLFELHRYVFNTSYVLFGGYYRRTRFICAKCRSENKMSWQSSIIRQNGQIHVDGYHLGRNEEQWRRKLQRKRNEI